MPQDKETAPVNTTGNEQNEQTTDNKEEKEDVITLPQGLLQKGDQGNDIESLQKALNELDYNLEETSQFDDKTTWAITDFQFQIDGLDITGIYDDKTKLALEAQFESDNQVKPGDGLPLQKTTETDDGIEVTGNPYEVLVLVNKEHALPDDFTPDDLVIPNVRFPFTEDLPKKQMRKVAADALEEMFDAADDKGLELFAQSGFRSFDRQEEIFAANVEKNGEEAANKYSARPGESEHQSGLTMDVTSADVGFDLIIDFGETPEGKWIEKHASDYGFIIRYPEGKEDITKYQYEPWHLRYVGEKAAKDIMDKSITFEEYLENL
ncbi:D-alanyl-D-alanine carboxypeptidase family protein [Virgibacillus sp. MSJ-26]|nr:D-alanyl-D-alanine carboxypeptidase family protein [Virgibacillus sp. MSJ-26]MBU5467590.1 D-alanyl-D-alanine carboxypeptidase family protein [Virgibacillus sp. MSJ-26]